MSTLLDTTIGTDLDDLGFPETPDLIYTESELIRAPAVRLLSTLTDTTTIPAGDTESIVALSELVAHGYVTVEDHTGHGALITVTDFGIHLLDGVRAQHPTVLA